MIVQCEECKLKYDDEFRIITCPHDTFLANDGQNNFKHYTHSYLEKKDKSND